MAASAPDSLTEERREEWCDIETGGRDHSRSMNMAPFSRSFTTFYWSAIVSIDLSCTIFELFDVKS